MNFSDYFFLIYFFPILLAIYLVTQSTPRLARLSNLILIIGSLLFYLSFGMNNIEVLLIPVFFDFCLAQLIGKTRNLNSRKMFFLMGVVTNLGLLGYFKYTHFLSGQLFLLVPNTFLAKLSTTEIFLPVGISFITFQRISYLTDVYKKKIKASTNFFHYTVYALLFPHLIAGPIVRYSEIFQEIKKRYVDYQSFFRGLVFFSVGLFLKTFIADQLFPLEEHLDTLITQLDTLKAVIITLSFSLRLYFDFLGYSLMAIGIASFFGFHFPDNFDSPYTSVSITDFWQKWNISLSLWIRDYIYIPLGGNRKGEIRTNLNLLITMILAGLWHGAGWNYIVWGTLHGCFLVTERILPQNIIAKLPKRIRQILTFILVSSLWVIFKFKTLSEAKLVFHAMTTWTFFPLEDITQNILFATIPAWLIGVFWIICIKEKNLKAIQPNVWKLIFFSCLLFFSISFSMVKRSIAFIYFQF